ncbi:hypothetical protein T4B_3566 [Trichinella pseudospiralis]|uniref:Uncharacterized protein n=1 Tax=Trichinella pseudospiralis TaxID=6337 RepID=A0A0V1E569_TRIPS|nr:hypothetical protein T4A_9259 [Trichinella pseudospiralis]KRZ28924.1 hypothetical protein T4B_3566 [Trichinella pseudospiralis]KRZ37164.1 hypothetical protein T4C_1417 [Trichinella pseudospiralis]
MAVQQFSQNIFRQLIDQYRHQTDDRTQKLLNAFENFERQLQESAQRLNEDRKQREDQLNNLQKKYSKWKLSKLQIPNAQARYIDQKCENLDSTTAEKKNMDELKCEIEQLKLQLNNVSGNLLDIREFLKNANNKAEQPKPRSPTTKQFESKLPESMTNVMKRQISTDSSTESEEDSFLNLKFTSIRNNTNDNNSRATATSREASEEKQRKNDRIERQLEVESSYSPPRVSFAFDRQRDGKIFNSHNSQLVHAETDTDHSPTSDKSQESRSVDEKNNIVQMNNNNNITTDTEEEESVKSELNSNDSHESRKKPRSGSYEPATNIKDKKDEDDFLAKLFPDKFGSKLTLSTTNASSKLSADAKELVTLIGSNQNYTDESDSDFFFS